MSDGKEEQISRNLLAQKIDELTCEQVTKKGVEFNDYFKNEYAKILRNFKKLQNEVLRKCLSKINNENEYKKEILTDLQTLFVFIYLSLASPQALGIEDRGVLYF
ncbi:MAG: hypothetical protein CfP315_0795 [Candidatus Improbicoccus pseudotrichonymphae]|uniref:Uncharacterized protein n=1 Tax=Candidatus Improbicoccus pseudotrichonymphae TaxID=3033792 RepID=A0AA48HVL9_9FIRM|nr:MAG: hypothetical protein CfP315_0795 [Candidatus Improbicoccus pseudotrichonymphae]